MEPALVLLVTAYFTVAVYLLLSRHIIRMLLGVALLGNAINLLIFTAGRLTKEIPPIVSEGAETLEQVSANPLPQALILTAIGYAASFYFLSLTLETIPVGIAYAVWSGVGLVLIATVGWLAYGQSLDLPAFIGMGLILAGVVVLNVFSTAAAH